MQYITKYGTEDHFTYQGTERKDYHDKNGVQQPGHKNKFNIHHFAILALFQWSQENAHAKKEMYKKHKLRFITQKTAFKYEVQTLVSMMHWDTFNKSFKFIMLNNSLKKKGTSFKEQYEKADLMLKEKERLSTAKFKRGMRYGRNFYAAVRIKFHAAVRIQEWWLRKKRKYRIYKNIYQLMDEYSVEGGFTGQDTAKYFGIGKGKNLLKIQEDIMKKVEMHRVKCREVSTKLVNTTLQNVIERQKMEACQQKRRKSCDEGPSCDDGPSCDEGPPGDEGPPSFLGRWARALGLTKQ